MAAPPSPRAASSRVELIVALVVCLAAVALALAMVLAETAGIHHEIQLAAPEAARPGQPIALRAYVYGTPDAPSGPTPIAPPVEVVLREGEAVLARVDLTEAAFASLEGTLLVPGSASGALTLEARAREGGEVVATVARILQVAPDAPPAAALERRAPTLAHFFLGPLVPDVPATEPSPATEAVPTLDEPFALDATVSGAVCIPEIPCVLVVDTASPGVDAALTDCVGVEPMPVPPSAAPTHYRALPLVVHGPEGSCELLALRGATRVAHRSIRMPVALATPYLRVEPAVSDEHVASLELVAPPGRDTVLVDVFADGFWVRTLTFEASADPSSPTRAQVRDLPTGRYLLQARADALPTDYVFARQFVAGAATALTGRDAELREPGVPPAQVLYRLSREEQHGLTLPLPASGLEADRARLERQKRVARYLAFGGMGLAILLLVLAVLRRGLAADAEARAVMVAAGVPGAGDRSARLRGTLNVVLVVLGLGLGCVVGGAFVAARQIIIDAPMLAVSPPIERELPNGPVGTGVAPSPPTP